MRLQRGLREHTRGIFVIAVLAAAALASCSSASAIAAPPSLLWQTPENGESGSGAGQVAGPRGIAVDPSNGHLFVADAGNARIDEFDIWGSFVKAWGWGVVASGPDNEPARNERQELSVNATGGTYKLDYFNAYGGGFSFRQQTVSIAFNASAATVQTALEGLESLEPGDVTVGGPDGGPYTIEFTGSYADSDIPLLSATPALTGGAETASVETVQGGGSFEVCVLANGDVCQAGQSGGYSPGQLPQPAGVAVDGSGDVYVKETVGSSLGEGGGGEASLRVQKFDPEGNFLAMWGGEVDKTSGANLCTKADLEGGDECGAGVPGTGDGQFQLDASNASASGIAIGPGGTVFAADVGRIQKFSQAGDFEGEVKVPGETIGSLAVDGAGNFYLTFAGKDGLRKLSASGALLQTLATEEPTKLKSVSGLAVSDDGGVYATGTPATVNTTGKPLIVKFDAAGAETIGPGQQLGESPVLGGGLATSTACEISGEDVYASYQGFLRAYGPPPDIQLCPPPHVPPTINESFATSVGPDSAVVRALINPHFWPDARYYVQYGTGDCSQGGCAIQPAAPGAELTDQTINAPVSTAGVSLAGLQPNTTYHYRFVAQSSGGGPVAGPDHTFTTFALPAAPDTQCANQVFRTGASAALPDCRAYEMVSPVEKGNGDAMALGAGDVLGRSALNQSSADGEKLAYATYRAFGDAQSAPFASAYIASRTAQGWQSQGISPPRGINLIPTNTATDTQFKAFSPDLCSGWVFQENDALLAPGAVKGFPDLYRRENCGAAAGTYQALTTVKPPNREPEEYFPEIVGISADGSHTIFSVGEGLAGVSDPGLLNPELYESFGAGKVRPVCVLPPPSNALVTTGCAAGTGTDSSVKSGRRHTVNNAISDDGSRIFWSNVSYGAGQIYVRINGKQTEAVSEKGEELSGHEGSQYWTAAEDGSRAIFTVALSGGSMPAEKVPALEKGESDLYEFDVDSKATTLIASDVYGVVGASENAKLIYFVSKEALAGAATAGQRNLYLYKAGAGGLTYIGALSRQDTLPSINSELSMVNAEPVKHAAVVSANGLQVVFMSSASLTGFDNTDAKSGQPDDEVYHYNATTGVLNCVSCNRTGARPTGRNIGGEGKPVWAAARIPNTQTDLYRTPEVLSPDGQRLFFESFEPLVPRDTNGVGDVYEWEAPNKGSCHEDTDAFNAANGGCIYLISSGESGQDSLIVGTSQSGNDVFISTTESLLSQDPGLIDIYDARVEGGFPPPPGAPQACEGEACQGPFSPPNDQTPASANFNGPGNVPPPRRCAKGKVRKKGRCVAKKRHKVAKRGHRRSGKHRTGSHKKRGVK